MSQTRYIEAEQISATRPVGAVRPRIELKDEMVILAAQLKRVFPLSNPDEFISIQDGAAKEIGILRSVNGLDPETLNIFVEELDRRYFTPKIEGIDDLKQEAGMWKFTVRTQRGPSEFYVRNWRDSGFEISPNRWQIHSVDGGRFDIPDLGALDARSQKLMLQLL